MKSLLSVLICLLIYSQSFAQVLYDPQNLYESPGGLFDPDSIRTVELTFYDQNYNFILDQGWQNETGIRLPALLEMNGQVYDSRGRALQGEFHLLLGRPNQQSQSPLQHRHERPRVGVRTSWVTTS